MASHVLEMKREFDEILVEFEDNVGSRLITPAGCKFAAISKLKEHGVKVDLKLYDECRSTILWRSNTFCMCVDMLRELIKATLFLMEEVGFLGPIPPPETNHGDLGKHAIHFTNSVC